MNSGYYPNVVNPKPRIQTMSQGFQAPFYFGGSQVPDNVEYPSRNEIRTGRDFPTNKKISRKIVLSSMNF
jgi:hypothetical protein